MDRDRVYLDYAASTPLRPEVQEFLLEGLARFGNPSSQHREGRRARTLIDEARENIAALFGVKPTEIIFTSGATESINTVISGYFSSGSANTLAISPIEHSAVLSSADFVQEKLGIKKVVLPVDSFGYLLLDEFKERLNEANGLLACQWVNQEVGTSQNLRAIAEWVDASGWDWFLDGAQAVFEDWSLVGKLPIQAAAFSAHKLGGPKGVGVLIKKDGFGFIPLIRGGSQELGYRAGTENPALIAAAVLAFGLQAKEAQTLGQEIARSRIELFARLANIFPGLKLLGPPLDHEVRSPRHLSLCFPGIDGEGLVLNLDMNGVAVSAGSACTSGSRKPSQVLHALGLSPQDNLSSLRLSLGRGLSSGELDRVENAFKEAIKSLTTE